MSVRAYVFAVATIAFSASVNAKLIEYDLSATMYYNDESGGTVTRDVVGSMFMDEPVFSIVDDSRIANFHYNISFFSITIGDYQYDGDGTMYSNVYAGFNPTTDYQVVAWDTFSLQSQDGLFSFGSVGTPNFYYADGTPYETNGLLTDLSDSDFFNLPYCIGCDADPGIIYNVRFSGYTGDMLDVVIQQTSIVPIPSAVWLFGSGLIGLVGLARRKTRV